MFLRVLKNVFLLGIKKNSLKCKWKRVAKGFGSSEKSANGFSSPRRIESVR